MLNSFTAALLSGVGIGFSVAAPIGPMGMMCIQRTLTSGVAAGLLTGLGSATVLVAYSAAAAFGLDAVAKPWIEAHAVALGVISATLLLFFALRARRTPIALEGISGGDGIRLSRAYLSALVVGVTNPLTPILFFAASQAFANQSSSTMVAGVFLGSAIWWIILSGVVAAARARLNTNLLTLSSKVAGLSLTALSAITLGRVVVRGLS